MHTISHTMSSWTRLLPVKPSNIISLLRSRYWQKRTVPLQHDGQSLQQSSFKRIEKQALPIHFLRSNKGNCRGKRFVTNSFRILKQVYYYSAKGLIKLAQSKEGKSISAAKCLQNALTNLEEATSLLMHLGIVGFMYMNIQYLQKSFHPLTFTKNLRSWTADPRTNSTN